MQRRGGNPADRPAWAQRCRRAILNLQRQGSFARLKPAQQGAQRYQFFHGEVLGHGSSLSVQFALTLPPES